MQEFLLQYPEQIREIVLSVRKLLTRSLPEVTEQLDIPAKMIAYTYGERYTDMICSIFPSQKGVKLSFYKGMDLPDPHHLLKGTGKTTRYLEIKGDHLYSIKPYLTAALKMYNHRSGK